MKIFCLVAISSVLQQCICKDIENMTMIYAIGDQAFAKKYGQNNTLTDLGEFDGNVTGFAKYKGYLYISVKRSWFFKKDSAIWRVKLDRTSSSGVDVSTWTKFHTVNAVREDVLCLVVAKGYIYAGRTDGKMWRCSADKPDSCEDFNQLDGIITAIDYNPVDDKIHVILHVARYFEYSIEMIEEFYILRSCSADTANSCDQKMLSYDKPQTHFFKFALNAVWFDINKSYLAKCSYERENEILKLSNDSCFTFNNIGSFDDIYLSASNKYLYVNTQPGGHIWRCDPNFINSCTRPFNPPIESGIGPFIIL